MVRLVRTVCTNAANTASKMKLATNLTVIVLMVVTLVGMEKGVTENVLLGLLETNATVRVEMVARIRYVIPSQESVPWVVMMDGSVACATKCVLRAILDGDAWRNVVDV